MHSKLLLGVVALLIIASVGYVVTQSNDATNTTVQTTESVQSEETDALPTVEDMPEGAEFAIETDESEVIVESEADATADLTAIDLPNNTTAGSYETYDAAKIAISEADHIILFFHATWCPSCVALDRNINANLASIPSGVEIYKLDYDSETELKQQYGIIRQHSVVEISADGAKVGSITHPPTLEQLVASL